MQSKSLLIAIAAFAVTTTGVQAFGNTEMLMRAGLSEAQIEAFTTARELREKGDVDAARDILLEAGVEESTLRSVRSAIHQTRSQMHEALEADDYEAFLEAIAGTPLADIITSEADFEQFKEAHEMREAGDWGEAADLFTDLGIDTKGKHPFHGRGQARILDELTAEQQEAFLTAKQGNDRETMRAILEEAGVEIPHAKLHGRHGEWY